MSKKSNKKIKVLPNEESEECVNSYKEKAISNSQVLVLDEFPKRILEIQQILTDERFSLNTFFSCESDINIPIPEKPSKERAMSLSIEYSDTFLFENGFVESNVHLIELIETLKPKALQLIGDSNSVKMGISLMIPKIEDGNNFGVEIQQEMLIGVAVVELKTRLQLDQISEYFRRRAEMVTKIAKYPHSMDYRQALQEMDYKFRLFLRLFAFDLRNQYIGLHDMFTKNLNKIKEPRNSDNHQLMY
ncbi:unnamed protein product [Medioppia subpectinata]|uniref:Proteasome activator complex subunit 3 n=1 Tax=Medioppia subpectinata TaxID=1979941 RepID=A0A7R9KR90_9ACAR|nr:unnamed protein product [Medioppia subpectinata]CAG2108319.1 unnamed protein product [Medioppia subpectinata]